MKHNKWTMRNTLLVLCIGSVVFALLLQTFLFHQSLRRQIRAESISDHEISLNKIRQICLILFTRYGEKCLRSTVSRIL